MLILGPMFLDYENKTLFMFLFIFSLFCDVDYKL